MSQSKGLVILYEDLSERWIQWAKAAGLTHIGVHKIAIPGTFAMKALVDDLQRPGGRQMIRAMEKAGITMEYELHSLEWLLPREMFPGNENLFRMNAEGVRTNDLNFCPSSPEAREVIAENARKLAKILDQSSHRYFLWPDDMINADCHCPACRARKITGSDAGIIFSNAVAEGLRSYDSQASQSYLAYADAKSVPTEKPAENVFLEFAPMDRDHNKPITDPTEKAHRDYVNLLDELLKIFPVETTQVLEYWLDNALYSGYKKPPVKLPLNELVLDADTAYYTGKGIRHIKSFGSYMDEEYYRLHGDPPMEAYGNVLAKYLD